jgi:hypothetical protein
MTREEDAPDRPRTQAVRGRAWALDEAGAARNLLLLASTTQGDVMLPTTPTTNELKRHLHESVELLKTLRDELRVELHLAGMEARTRFKEIEGRILELERVASRLTSASKERFEEARLALEAFRASYNRPNEPKN